MSSSLNSTFLCPSSPNQTQSTSPLAKKHIPEHQEIPPFSPSMTSNLELLSSVTCSETESSIHQKKRHRKRRVWKPKGFLAQMVHKGSQTLEETSHCMSQVDNQKKDGKNLIIVQALLPVDTAKIFDLNKPHPAEFEEPETLSLTLKH